MVDSSIGTSSALHKSGVGVLDKLVAILDAVEFEPASLAELVAKTGINRATAHRLATAMEGQGLLRRVDGGRFVLGYRLWVLGQSVPGAGDLATRVQPYLDRLRDLTGESSQLYVRDGEERVCLATAESAHGLRTIVAVGARLTLERGSAGAVFRQSGGRPPDDAPGDRSVTATPSWIASVAEREPGVASVSAPVTDSTGSVVAVVSVSGPIERTSSDPGQRYGHQVSQIADEMTTVMG